MAGLLIFKIMKKEQSEINQYKALPSTWKDFCNIYPTIKTESSTLYDASIYKIEKRYTLDEQKSIPSTETARALVVFQALIYLRDCYNDGWEPDWTNNEQLKYAIYYEAGAQEISTATCKCASFPLVFKTPELRDRFLHNFRYMLEIAKPLF